MVGLIRTWRLRLYFWLRRWLMIIADRRDREFARDINRLGNTRMIKLIEDEITKREALGER